MVVDGFKGISFKITKMLVDIKVYAIGLGSGGLNVSLGLGKSK